MGDMARLQFYFLFGCNVSLRLLESLERFDDGCFEGARLEWGDFCYKTLRLAERAK